GFFFFQAEDGIRDLTVTGVQTCALPICTKEPSDLIQVFRLVPVSATRQSGEHEPASPRIMSDGSLVLMPEPGMPIGVRLKSPQRSEERRVGKECRCRWLTYRANNR